MRLVSLILFLLLLMAAAGCGGSVRTTPVGEHVSCPTSQACKTNMQLVCHRASGRTVLSQVPNGMNGVIGSAVWFKFPKHSTTTTTKPGHGWTKWMPGPNLKHGRVTYRWLGAQRAKAFVHIPNGVGEPATEMFIISATCTR